MFVISLERLDPGAEGGWAVGRSIVGKPQRAETVRKAGGWRKTEDKKAQGFEVPRKEWRGGGGYGLYLGKGWGMRASGGGVVFSWFCL